MIYHVVYSPHFEQDLRLQVNYFRDNHVADVTIDRWVRRLLADIELLSQLPRRYPPDQRATRDLGFEVRRFVFEKRVVTYRVDDFTKTVRVLALIHGARRK